MYWDDLPRSAYDPTYDPCTNRPLACSKCGAPAMLINLDEAAFECECVRPYEELEEEAA